MKEEKEEKKLVDTAFFPGWVLHMWSDGTVTWEALKNKQLADISTQKEEGLKLCTK